MLYCSRSTRSERSPNPSKLPKTPMPLVGVSWFPTDQVRPKMSPSPILSLVSEQVRSSVVLQHDPNVSPSSTRFFELRKSWDRTQFMQAPTSETPSTCRALLGINYTPEGGLHVQPFLI